MAFAFTRTLEHDGSLVPTSQANFTALFSVTDNGLRTSANGGNIENTDSGKPADFAIYSGVTALDFKVVSYNATTGAVIGWVKVPTLNSGSATTLTLKYGDAAVTTYQGDDTNVWHTNVASIYELSDGSSLSLNDSTANAKHGTGVNTPTAATGKVNGGMDLERSSTQYVTLPTNTLDVDSFTISAWVNAESFSGTYNTVFAKVAGGFSPANELLVRSDGKLTCFVAMDSGNLVYDGTGSHTLSTGTWYRVSMTMDSASVPSRLTGYVNGVSDNSVTSIFDTASGTANTRIGSDPGTASREWDGLLDEVWLISDVLSADWLLTEYNNQNAPASFWTLGSEDQVQLDHAFAGRGLRRILRRR